MLSRLSDALLVLLNLLALCAAGCRTNIENGSTNKPDEFRVQGVGKSGCMFEIPAVDDLSMMAWCPHDTKLFRENPIMEKWRTFKRGLDGHRTDEHLCRQRTISQSQNCSCQSMHGLLSSVGLVFAFLRLGAKAISSSSAPLACGQSCQCAYMS